MPKRKPKPPPADLLFETDPQPVKCPKCGKNLIPPAECWWCKTDGKKTENEIDNQPTVV